MLIASNADLVPLPADKAGQADGFSCLAGGSAFSLLTPWIYCQGRSGRHLSFLPSCSGLGKFISMANFPSCLQKDPSKSSHTPCPRMPWGWGSGTPGERGTRQGSPSSPARSSAERRGCNSPSPCQIFCCLRLYFCAYQEPQTTQQTACVVRDHPV